MKDVPVKKDCLMEAILRELGLPVLLAYLERWQKPFMILKDVPGQLSRSLSEYAVRGRLPSSLS